MRGRESVESHLLRGKRGDAERWRGKERGREGYREIAEEEGKGGCLSLRFHLKTTKAENLESNRE